MNNARNPLPHTDLATVARVGTGRTFHAHWRGDVSYLDHEPITLCGRPTSELSNADFALLLAVGFDCCMSCRRAWRRMTRGTP